MPRSHSNNSSAKRSRHFLLVLDAGTTTVKAFVFHGKGRLVTRAYRRLHKSLPRRGWVEQDPREIITASVQALRSALAQAGVSSNDRFDLGITNQRETTILWDRLTGSPFHPAIVWEDRRTRRACAALHQKGGKIVREKTGLPLDAYFSASKVRWLLNHVQNTKRFLASNRLAFGTVDSWLLWNLCEEHPHVTDETNASRTLLFNIKTKRWDHELLDIFDVPPAILPRVLPSRSTFGVLSEGVLGVRVSVKAVCGDQQASMYAALKTSAASRGVTKVTYGTGAFVMQTIGRHFALHPPFFTTIVPAVDGPLYALEAKIDGAAVHVDRLLHRPTELRRYLTELARQVDSLLRRLPQRPRTLVIDGGVSRDGLLEEIQGRVSGVSVLKQEPYDGTALGIARMLK